MTSALALDSALVAVFYDFADMECAIRKVVHCNFDIKNISALGCGFHNEEDIVRSAITLSRHTAWSADNANWSGLWSLLFGGICINVPALGATMIVGQLAIIVATYADEKASHESISCVGVTLAAMGIHRDAVIVYERVLQQSGFLVVLHGPPNDLERVRSMLEFEDSADVHIHQRIDMRMLASK